MIFNTNKFYKQFVGIATTITLFKVMEYSEIKTKSNELLGSIDNFLAENNIAGENAKQVVKHAIAEWMAQYIAETKQGAEEQYHACDDFGDILAGTIWARICLNAEKEMK